ncbi:MAG: UDP-glucose 4-epimerase GalE [Niameybacter sp.]|uniref:UDP-glucose 4-epimerase GalE n=1 Tax=Niameybacter sp. TaxID=2033640 RepID=UPI002FC702CD
MKILVTGGAGYIGSHTCVELLEAGYEVVIIDDFSNSKPSALEKIKQLSGKEIAFYEGDVKDRALLDRILEEHEIHAAIHFAGYKAVGESCQIPLAYYHNNLTSTFVLCEAMAAHNVKKLVFSSSATVYGDPATVPIDESFPTSTTNPYGATKLMIENIMQDVYKADNAWRVALLRYFNPVGAHKSGLIGEEPNGIPNNLMPYIAKVAVGELEALNVFGDDYATVDGTGVRDYIHVVDLAKGHVQAIKRITEVPGIDTYNLGTGHGYSVLEMVKAFEKASGKEVAYRIAPRRPGDIAACYAKTEKAKRLLDWEATKDVDEMCEDSWRFMMNRAQELNQ